MQPIKRTAHRAGAEVGLKFRAGGSAPLEEIVHEP
jgi:hypothetical protein